MAKKYIIQSNQIIEVVYINSCQSAKGGRKELKEIIDMIATHTIMSQDYDYIDACEKLLEGTPLRGVYHDKNYVAREKKRKAVIEELIFNNFAPHNYGMLTLTFSTDRANAERYETILPDNMNEEQELMSIMEYFYRGDSSAKEYQEVVKIYDPKLEKLHNLKYCNKLFKQFIQRMKYRYPLFRYVGVMSKQDNGNWHYHLICNLNYIPFDELRKLWRNGAVYFHSFKKTGMTGMWKAVRYLQKNMQTVRNDLKGEKGYVSSKGL